MKRNRPYPHFKFPDEINIEYFLMSETACMWHNVPNGSYEIRCSNYGWFPTNVLMGTNAKGNFTDTNNIGANIGGNMGTAGMAVMNIKQTIKMLNEAGYNSVKESLPILAY